MIVNNRQHDEPLSGGVMTSALSEYSQVGVGIVVPYDFALDRELWRWAPAESTLHLTRLPVGPVAVTVEMVTKVGDSDHVRLAVGDLLTVRPSVLAYRCTSGSFIKGLAGEQAVVAAMLDAGAPLAVTTSGALLQALDLLGVDRVSIATPYSTASTAGLRDFLVATGRQVVGVSELNLTTNIWTVPQRGDGRSDQSRGCAGRPGHPGVLHQPGDLRADRTAGGRTRQAHRLGEPGDDVGSAADGRAGRHRRRAASAGPLTCWTTDRWRLTCWTTDLLHHRITELLEPVRRPT